MADKPKAEIITRGGTVQSTETDPLTSAKNITDSTEESSSSDATVESSDSTSTGES